MNKKLMKNRGKKKKGFTLVELIIVIAIIAILAAMAIPKFSSVRLDAKISNDVAAAKNIQSAAAMMVANGSLTVPHDAFDADKNDDLKSRIQGAIVPTAGGSATAFSVAVDPKGDVTVSAAGKQLAPATDSTEKEYKSGLGN